MLLEAIENGRHFSERSDLLCDKLYSVTRISLSAWFNLESLSLS